MSDTLAEPFGATGGTPTPSGAVLLSGAEQRYLAIRLTLSLMAAGCLLGGIL